MSRNLGRQYQAINSPWADYTVYSFPNASHIAASDRQPLMDAMNGIIAVNWNATEPHWTAASPLSTVNTASFWFMTVPG